MAAPMKVHVLSKFCKKVAINSYLPPCTGISQRHYAVGKYGSPNRLEEIDHPDDDDFRVLVIPGHTPIETQKRERRFIAREVPPPRSKTMPIGQDWTNVWPAAQTFKWSTVPFPVKQGMVEKSENEGIPPGKYGNAELMKIPNFLHATPAHVKKHCALLKKYCTSWPDGLETEADIQHHFPVEVVTRDYVVDAPTPRDARARTVTVKVQLSSLELDYHARDKLLRLVGNKHDPNTGIITITSDRCPLKKQNYDFCMYVLTALYHESWKTEDWESEKQIADMEKYFWDIMPSKKSTVSLLQKMKEVSPADPSSPLHNVDVNDDTVAELEPVKQYKHAVEKLHNEGEDTYSLDSYKDSVAQLLGISVSKE